MTQRQRKHRLNISRREEMQSRCWAPSGWFCIAHSERDWKQEFGVGQVGVFIGEPVQGETGVLDGGIRFIVSEVDHVSDQR